MLTFTFTTPPLSLSVAEYVPLFVVTVIDAGEPLRVRDVPGPETESELWVPVPVPLNVTLTPAPHRMVTDDERRGARVVVVGGRVVVVTGIVVVVGGRVVVVVGRGRR